MQAVLLKSFTFIFIIFLGNVLKQKGFFDKKDSSLISKIVIKITLPCALLASATSLTFNATTIALLSLGLASNIIMAFGSRLLFAKDSKVEKGSAMFNCSGYNIGNITIPFASVFFAGTGMSYVCMFDIGNSISWLGAVYASANNLVKEDGSKFSIKSLVSTLSKSIPFMTYMLILVLALFNLRLPSQITSVVGSIGSANSFLVMLMIGIMLDIKIGKSQIEKVVKVLGFRLAGFISLSLIVYFLLPLPMLAKEIAMLCLASPIPSVATVFCKELGNESSIPALVNSLSIIIGIICSSAVLMLFV